MPRSPWPWLLAVGPAIVVVASMASAWLAISGGDPVVADDYYKLGLTINRKLAARAPDPAATIVIESTGEVSVRLQGTGAAPNTLRLTLQRPGAREQAQALTLRPSADGTWVGVLRDVGDERRIVTLESDALRLPVTVVDRLPAVIRLGMTGPDR